MSEEIKLVQAGISYGSFFVFTVFVILTTIYISRYFIPVTINVDDEGNVYVKKEVLKYLNVSFKKGIDKFEKESNSLIEDLKAPAAQTEGITESATEMLRDNLTDPLVTDRMFN